MKPFFNYYGGQYYNKADIIKCLPMNTHRKHYIECCIGAGSVFLNKTRSITETINDINPKIVNLWTVVRDRCEELYDTLYDVDYNENQFLKWKDLETTCPVKMAASTFIKYRMSRGGAGVSFGESSRMRGGRPEGVNKFINSVDNLKEVSLRCQGVNITNKSVFQILSEVTDEHVLYVDPPYPKDTRTANAKEIYDFEMSNSEHLRLVTMCEASPASIVLTSYDNDIYNETLKSFKKYYCSNNNASAVSRVGGTNATKKQTAIYVKRAKT